MESSGSQPPGSPSRYLLRSRSGTVKEQRGDHNDTTADDPSAPEAPSPFLELLPPELRNRVYVELLSFTAPAWWAERSVETMRKVCHPQILATCKQINNEASGLLELGPGSELLLLYKLPPHHVDRRHSLELKMSFNGRDVPRPPPMPRGLEALVLSFHFPEPERRQRNVAYSAYPPDPEDSVYRTPYRRRASEVVLQAQDSLQWSGCGPCASLTSHIRHSSASHQPWRGVRGVELPALSDPDSIIYWTKAYPHGAYPDDHDLENTSYYREMANLNTLLHDLYYDLKATKVRSVEVSSNLLNAGDGEASRLLSPAIALTIRYAGSTITGTGRPEDIADSDGAPLALWYNPLQRLAELQQDAKVFEELKVRFHKRGGKKLVSMVEREFDIVPGEKFGCIYALETVKNLQQSIDVASEWLERQKLQSLKKLS